MLAYVYIHLVWATYNREPLITAECERVLYDLITEKCREFRCKPLALGGIEDHVHLVVRYRPSVNIAHLVKHIKGSSSHFIANVLAPATGFRWQGTYGAFTFAEPQVGKIAGYAETQKERHKSGRLWPQLEQCEEEGVNDDEEL